MKLKDFKKEDFKIYRRELFLTIGYTLALAIVYSSWTHVSTNNFGLTCLVASLIVLVGIIFYFIWILKIKENHKKGD